MMPGVKFYIGGHSESTYAQIWWFLNPLPASCTPSYISRRPRPTSYVLRTFFTPLHTRAHTHYTFRKLTKPWLFIMMWITNYGLLGFFYKKKRHTWQVVCLSCLQILLKSEFFTVLRDGFFQILSYKSF